MCLLGELSDQVKLGAGGDWCGLDDPSSGRAGDQACWRMEDLQGNLDPCGYLMGDWLGIISN